MSYTQAITPQNQIVKMLIVAAWLLLTAAMSVRKVTAGTDRLEFEVVLWASELSQETQAAILSCPYNVSVIGLGQTWGSNGFKLGLALDFVRSQTNQEKVLLFADSHDILFQGATEACPNSETYAAAFWGHQADLIFQSDGGCGWATTEICGQYPQDQAKPFLNSGVFVTSVGALDAILTANLLPLQALNSVPSHDQGFWHILYSQQQKAFQGGKTVPTIMAVDYSESLAGTSLAHSVWSAKEIYQDGGDLAYAANGSHHKIGCILHAQGQNGGLIESGLPLQLRQAFKSRFIANSKRTIKLSKQLQFARAIN